MDCSLALGTSKIGLTMAAQLLDSDGVNVGVPVLTGFFEVGNGSYLWHYIGWPHGFRGGVKFYENGVPGTTLAFVSVNPEDLEYIDLLTAPEDIDIEVSHSMSRIDLEPGVL